MITQLTISNFAIIDKLEVIFKDGLIVLTGETGAGKSIIVDALDFLLGARGNTDLLKTGANKAQIEGLFSLGKENSANLIKLWLEKNGFEISDENNITISRELTAQGSKVRINGSLANISHLLYLRQFLLNIHQQSEHIELLKIEKQLDILDGFGNESHLKLIEDYKRTFEEYIAAKKRLNDSVDNSSTITKRLELLSHEVNEITSANIKDPEEEEKLFEKREILLNKKDLVESSSQIYEIINGEGINGLLVNLSQIKKLLANSSRHDRAFEPYVQSIESIISETKELSSFVNEYSSTDYENENLDEIEDRLDLFYDLKRKYGKTFIEIREYLQKTQGELDELKKSSVSSEELKIIFNQKESNVKALGEKLTRSREDITKSFVNKVNEELASLGFKQAVLVVEFTDCGLSMNGKEQIQFLFTANPDEPPKALLKVASGGELSRIMLAIKSITARSSFNLAPTMIFDEIDIGVSGEIASSVAKKLFKISKQSQVICITHQPIIAAMADQHFLIEKNILEGSTFITVKEVSQEEKAEALAALLNPDKKSRESITTNAKQFAKSLLENAESIKEVVSLSKS